MPLLAVFNREDVVFVSLCLPNFVFDRLDAGLVVVLVDFAVDGDGFFEFLDRDDGFFSDCGLEGFID